MATQIVAGGLRGKFPSSHNHCDRCDGAVHYADGTRSERETAAGTFKFRLCRECGDKLERMNVQARERATVRAMVNHATRYSPEFGQFVADWYGVRS